ncbi:MAG: hypothetical protein KBT27_03065 [Prevotellaceae bacterium]|nr:hypothetical protein [Candidatus Faecinaster equi]
MKRLFFLFVVLTSTLCANAGLYQIHLKSGEWKTGTPKVTTPDTIVIQDQMSYKNLTFTPKDVSEVYPTDGSRVKIVDGHFTYQTREEVTRLESEARVSVEAKRMQNPNYTIGKAIRSAGKVMNGLGIPSFIVGAILLGYGQGSTNAVAKGKASASQEQLQTYSNCATAGCVLLPFGASMTVAGITLSAKGKQLMELKVNYTGNGAGLALAW